MLPSGIPMYCISERRVLWGICVPIKKKHRDNMWQNKKKLPSTFILMEHLVLTAFLAELFIGHSLRLEIQRAFIIKPQHWKISLRQFRMPLNKNESLMTKTKGCMSIMVIIQQKFLQRSITANNTLKPCQNIADS